MAKKLPATTISNLQTCWDINYLLYV